MSISIKKFCTSCQQLKHEDGGGWKLTANKSKRWQCTQCTAKISVSQYKRKPDEAPYIPKRKDS
jgi:hypothetical protein